jgi:hypothetical protein
MPQTAILSIRRVNGEAKHKIGWGPRAISPGDKGDLVKMLEGISHRHSTRISPIEISFGLQVPQKRASLTARPSHLVAVFVQSENIRNFE